MDMSARAKASNIKTSQIKSTNSPAVGQIPSCNSNGTFTWIDNGGAGTDAKNVKVSSTDTSPDFLESKLSGTTNISITKINQNANEKLVIDLNAYAFNKLNGTGNYVIQYTNDAVNKRPIQEVCTGDITSTTTYEYIPAGQLNAGKPSKEVTTENGKIVTKIYEYDSNGLLFKVTVSTISQ